jgi:hypothetical protein
VANKTYQQLLSEARVIVQDTYTDPTLQRYPDQTLVDMLNRSLQELYRIRPDAFYDLWDDTAQDFVVPVVVIDATVPPIANSWLNPLGIPMMFYAPLVNRVIGLLESVDDEYTEDSRSQAFLADFKAMVVGL